MDFFQSAHVHTDCGKPLGGQSVCAVCINLRLQREERLQKEPALVLKALPRRQLADANELSWLEEYFVAISASDRFRVVSSEVKLVATRLQNSYSAALRRFNGSQCLRG